MSAPAWIKKGNEKSDNFQSARRQTDLLRDSGASEAELYQLRESNYGAEAANRLKALDEQRQQWQLKLSSYRYELNSLLAGKHIDDVESEPTKYSKNSAL